MDYNKRSGSNHESRREYGSSDSRPYRSFNGESNLAGKEFFDTDKDFRVAEFMHFCSHMLKKEPKEAGKAPAMIVFCAFEQLSIVIDYAKQYGFNGYIPLVFIKNFSATCGKAM